MKALYFDGENGEIVRTEEIPQNLLAEAKAKREELIEAASLFSDELTEAILEERRNNGGNALRRLAQRHFEKRNNSCLYGIGLQKQSGTAHARRRELSFALSFR